MNQIYVNRFWQRVNKTDACWLWLGALTDRGYGMFYAGKMRRAHIVSYELTVGSVPEGLELHHTCRVRHCVNPNHLRAVTHKENCQEDFVKNHCKNGHPWTPENTYTTTKQRFCRTCGNIRNKAYRLRRKI